MSCARGLAVLCFGFAPLACFTYPCERDVVACQDDDAFTIDRSCKLETPLVATLGEGDGEFVALAGDGWPLVHHGPQGGVHFLLGLRVEGMDPAHCELQIVITAHDEHVLADRTLVVGRDQLDENGDAFELADIVVVLERAPKQHGELVVDITDSCGRTTTLTRAP
ncbi:MAG TPA: hypothetical protein VG755_38220 [Nannocystaceae bacterium]|nr:hypothetical protein [Nannocystaceae bacterium]